MMSDECSKFPNTCTQFSDLNVKYGSIKSNYGGNYKKVIKQLQTPAKIFNYTIKPVEINGEQLSLNNKAV